MSRVDMWKTAVKFAAGRGLGDWDNFTGGTIDSDAFTYRAGGMAQKKSLGGLRTVEDITVSRLYEHERDHSRKAELIAAVGKADMVVTRTLLDFEAVAYGSPIVYTGKLKSVKFPEHQSEGTDAGLIELVIMPDTEVSAG